MRGVNIFSGSSHQALTSAICDRLGMQVAGCELTKFSNGETSVSIGPSTRNHDVYIVQSGSKKMNDSVMELLIMASACKGGSAKSITAVLPYFPYCRQSKKKSHRGAITARMLANLLAVAGVKHIITVDLHADPIKGFFGCPVDNLRAEPLIARWIRSHVPDWQKAVVVSKNAGGSKRITSMADALKLSFGIITTDRRRNHYHGIDNIDGNNLFNAFSNIGGAIECAAPVTAAHQELETHADRHSSSSSDRNSPENMNREIPRTEVPHVSQQNGNESPLRKEIQSAQVVNLISSTAGSSLSRSLRKHNQAPTLRSRHDDDIVENFNDERARDVIHGRLVQGHIVDDNYPSPALSTVSSAIGLPPAAPGTPGLERQDPMAMSIMSTVSSLHQDGLGGAGDGTASDEDEASLNNPEIEHTITLVGNVKNRTVFLIDDMIDRSEAWIAAAETVVKRGGAKQVYCIATHGLFGGDCLEQMEGCECIDYVVVCNTFPIEPERVQTSRKLVTLDLSSLISEAIRRNHFGESVSNLYQFYQD